MSRICALCLALCLLFVLVACSNGTSVQTNEPNTTQAVGDVAELTETTASEPIKDSGFDFEIIPTEGTYEQRDMGDVPETVSLSELDFDTTYVYSINHYQDAAPNPQIINDTDYTAVKVWIQVDNNTPNEFVAYAHTVCEYRPLIRSIVDSNPALTLSIRLEYVDIEQVLIEDNYILLSNCDVGDIDTMGKFYLYNNTESVVTVQVDTGEYQLEPYAVLESSPTYKAAVIDIE